jgi:hypothetical protein
MINLDDKPYKRRYLSDVIATFVFKYLTPIFTTLFLGFYILASFQDIVHEWLMTISSLCFIIVVNWFCWQIMLVQIDENYIYVTHFATTIQIPLLAILDVKEKRLINFRPVYVSFKYKTRFGRQIMFIPRLYPLIGPFETHPFVDELRKLSKRKL